LVLGRERRGAPRPFDGRNETARALLLLAQAPRRLHRALLKPSALGLQPMVERGGLVDEEPRQERTTIERQPFRNLTAIEGILETGDVGPDPRPVESQLLWSPARQHLFANRRPDKMDGAIEGFSRSGFVERWPQKAEQRVPPVEPAGRRDGQVKHERQAFRLSQNRLQGPIVVTV